ncbi:MAG: ATP-binding cassette domain-containing protein [Hydrogenophaga sp.]|nr:ATP-binding cassette domain-containing protein [Hydrogenophaga sp.]
MNSRLPHVAIDIHDLRVEAGGRCLLHVPALTVHHGERLALVGPNGAGKSTLLKALGGLLPMTRGRVTVLGRTFGAPGQRPSSSVLSAHEWRRLRAEVGQVMQGLHLVPRLSAADNVVLGALGRAGAMPRWRSWLRLYPPALRHEAEAALADLGLSERQHTRADQLSGGERQKVSLARLRLQRPHLILADEPTAALDPNATQQACAALLTVAQQATLLTVVHQPALMHQLADRVLGLASGQIVFDLPVAQVSPATLERLYATQVPPTDPTHGTP